jgi:hypothetical protein
MATLDLFVPQVEKFTGSTSSKDFSKRVDALHEQVGFRLLSQT